MNTLLSTLKVGTAAVKSKNLLRCTREVGYRRNGNECVSDWKTTTMCGERRAILLRRRTGYQASRS